MIAIYLAASALDLGVATETGIVTARVTVGAANALKLADSIDAVARTISAFAAAPAAVEIATVTAAGTAAEIEVRRGELLVRAGVAIVICCCM